MAEFMTEQKWLNCTDPEPMLDSLQSRASDRKLRLFACACSRLVWHLLDRKGRHVVKIAEDFADGKATQQRLATANAAARIAAGGRRWDVPSDVSNASAWAAAKGAAQSTAQEAGNAAAKRAERIGVSDDNKRDEPGNNLWDDAWDAAEQAIRKAQASLVREIFRLQPVAIPSGILAWNDQTIVKLARSIYDEREPRSGHLRAPRLTVLADALEEAGCTDADILNHCRESGSHMRGCWVVDLVLDRG